MSVAALALMWALIGVALAGAHLWMLRRVLQSAETLDPGRAGYRLAISMPLRLLAIAPVLALAARAGLVACVGLVAGSLAGRWLGLRLLTGRTTVLTVTPSTRCRKQG